MKSPFNENTIKAFKVFYDTPLIFSKKKGNFKETIWCSIFTDNTQDPLSDDAMDTNRESINIIKKKKKWSLLKSVERGDKIERSGFLKNRYYTINNVMEDDIFGYVINASSNKK